MAHTTFDGFVHPFLNRDVGTLLRERARQFGDKPFLIWAPFEDAHARTWTWREFEHDVARLAGGLIKRGVKPGDRVLVHFDNCPETFLARFACAWIGAIAVLSNSVLAGPEIAHVVALSGARAAITQPKLAARVAEHGAGLEWIAVTATDAGDTPDAGAMPAKADRFEALFADPAPPRAPDPDAPAMILFTTGTTSRPKAVLWTHANVLWGGYHGALHQAIQTHDVYQVFLPVYHVVGFSWSFLSALWAGASIVLQPRFSASRFWAPALAHKATMSSQVPFTANALLRGDMPKHHHFRQFMTGVALPDVARGFGVREIPAWGMTEMVSLGIVGDIWSEMPARSIGRPSPAYRIVIEDDNRKPVEPGQTGHLKVLGQRGLTIFKEYFNAPDATRATFDDRGYFDPGDRVVLHENGWIEFGDRTKDVLKVGGEGVSGAEVELAIAQVAGVREAAVVGRNDAVWGEAPVAFVIPRDGDAVSGPGADALRAAIVAHCRANLAKFKQPHDIHLVAEFPRVGFGKVAKVALREMAEKMAPAKEGV